MSNYQRLFVIVLAGCCFLTGMVPGCFVGAWMGYASSKRVHQTVEIPNAVPPQTQRIASDNRADASPTPARKQFTRKELEKIVFRGGPNQTDAEIIKAIGKPDKTTDSRHAGGELLWYYFNLTIDDTTGKTDRVTTFRMLGNPPAVAAILYH